VTLSDPGPYAPPRAPSAPRGRVPAGRVALVVGAAVALAVLAAAVVWLVVRVGAPVLDGVFGTCRHTPAVAAAVERDLEERGYEVPLLTYDCIRDPAAQVVGDEVLVGVVPPGRFASADAVAVAVRDDLVGAGWVHAADDEEQRLVVSRDGYDLTVDVHSSDPALALLTARRGSVDAATPWDTREGSADERGLTQDEVRRYALIPDRTPTWAPERFGTWSTRYDFERTEFRGSTGEDGDGRFLRVRVLPAPDGADVCAAAVGACAVVGTASNGLVVQQILEPADRGERPKVSSYGVGSYVAQADGVLVVLGAGRTREPGDYAPQPRPDEVVDAAEVLRVLGSVDAGSVAAAR
jgi:hypothetical protein